MQYIHHLSWTVLHHCLSHLCHNFFCKINAKFTSELCDTFNCDNIRVSYVFFGLKGKGLTRDMDGSLGEH